MHNKNDIYTTIAPSELWKIYEHLDSLFRGGGNSESPKLIRANGPRAADFTLIYDPIERCQVVIPDRMKGLSFSDSIERLERIPIPGRVWLLPKGTALPEGLCFNYKTLDHPLLNVSRRMSVVELTAKLTTVSSLLKRTDTTIKDSKR